MNKPSKLESVFMVSVSDTVSGEVDGLFGLYVASEVDWFLFDNLETARNCILRNITDISEGGFYQFAIIQELKLNHILPEEGSLRELYSWNRKEEKYEHLQTMEMLGPMPK